MEEHCGFFDELDKKILVESTDGKIYIGYLRSFDQFGNLVLHRTVERIYDDSKFGEVPIGLLMIRGDSIFLLGEFDEEKDRTKKLIQVSEQEILKAQDRKLEENKEHEEALKRALKERKKRFSNLNQSKNL